jgi:23S rRNA pseudouridine2605 synthase
MNRQDADLPTTALPDAAEAAVAEEAPKRRRAPRKKAEAAPGAQPESGVVAGAGVAAANAPPAEATLPPQQSSAEPEAAAAAGGTAADGAPGAPAGDGAAGSAAAGERRRSRNRRRGRRSGRGERGDAGAAPLGDAVSFEAAAVEPREVGEVFTDVLSGGFDVEPEPEPADAATRPRRVLAPEPDAPKLHKVLAQAGIGSRREMEQMIVEGRITVNGEPAHIGQRISFGDRISVGGKPVRVRIAPAPPRVLAYHKPAGEVVTHDDPQQRPTVFRKLPRLPQGKWQSVGRLDINTEGLLLFTSSGELANQLMHPRFGVEREYAVRSLGVLSDEERAKLLEGVEIDGQRCAFKSIEDGGGEGVNHWYRVVITEGRNREVRKLFEAAGHGVSRLIRIRYGSMVLPRGLRRGLWVELGADDVRALRRLAGAERNGPPREPREPRDEAGGEGARRRRRRRGRDGAGVVDAVEHDEASEIPNPLQQTYDKRAFQQARQPRREIPEDGPIPNPLQQTYDKRALHSERKQREIPEDGPIPNPLQQTFDRRFAHANKARGAGHGGGKRGGGGGGGRQPDPMRTSVGYIGADALKNSGGRGGRRGGRRR